MFLKINVIVKGDMQGLSTENGRISSMLSGVKCQWFIFIIEKQLACVIT